MSGPVLRFDAVSDDTCRRERAGKLYRALHVAWQSAEASPSRETAYGVFKAAHRYADFCERTAKHADRILNAALASDSFTAEERARILDTKKIKARDAKLLIDSEVELLEDYRACSPKARQAFREMLRWAKVASPNKGRRRRELTDEAQEEEAPSSPRLANIGKPVIDADFNDDRPSA